MNYEVTVGSRTLAVTVRRASEGGWFVSVDDGEETHVAGGSVGAGEWIRREGDVYKSVGVAAHGDDVDVQIAGHPIRVTVIDPRRAALQLHGIVAEGQIVTQMPGAIVAVLVEQGDVVKDGQPIVVVEAMKMENEFKSPCDGVVELVHVQAGDRVETGAVLVTVNPRGA